MRETFGGDRAGSAWHLALALITPAPEAGAQTKAAAAHFLVSGERFMLTLRRTEVKSLSGSLRVGARGRTKWSALFDHLVRCLSVGPSPRIIFASFGSSTVLSVVCEGQIVGEQMGRRSGRGTRDASVGYKCLSWHVKGSPVAFSLSVTEGTQD